MNLHYLRGYAQMDENTRAKGYTNDALLSKEKYN